jgi:hypothetical protein
MPSISEIAVTIRANTKPFIKNVKKASRAVSRFGKNIVGSLTDAMFSLQGLIAGVFAGMAFKEFIGGAIGAASGLEALNAQFKTLLGSQEEATKRMDELTTFSAKTPFQIEDIGKANKILESLTEGALSTAEGMTLVGDTAAFANQPINELAIHIGRLFSGIKGGTAVGESLMRLQEVGALTGDARKQIEELTKSGADSAKIWGVVQNSLGKFSGTMEAMSQTTQGLWSTLKDNLNLAMADLGSALLPMVKAGLDEAIKGIGSLRDWFSGLKIDFTSLAKVGIAFVKMIEIMGNAIGEMFTGQDTNNALKSFENNILKMFGTIAFFIKKMSEAKGSIVDDFKDMGHILLIAIKTPIKVGEKMFTEMLDRFTRQVINLWQTIQDLGALISASLRKDATATERAFNAVGAGVKRIFEISADSASKQLDILTDFSGTYEELLAEYAKKTKDVQDGKITSFMEALVGDKGERNKFINQFLQDVRNRFEEWKLKQLDVDVNVKTGDIDAKADKKADDLLPKLAKKGSQEAAAAQAGVISEQQKLLKVNEMQLDALKKMARNTIVISGEGLVGGLFTEDIVSPFLPFTQEAQRLR